MKGRCAAVRGGGQRRGPPGGSERVAGKLPVCGGGVSRPVAGPRSVSRRGSAPSCLTRDSEPFRCGGRLSLVGRGAG